MTIPRSPRVGTQPPRRWLATCALGIACLIPGAMRAAEPDVDAGKKPVTGRLGFGAMVDSRYSGGADYEVFPVPLASLDFGDYAYIEYWQAGVYVLANAEKTLALSVIATPRLGFNANDGPRLAGMGRRKWAIETGPSIDYGTAAGGMSIAYLHDVTGASNGGLFRLLGSRRVEFSDGFGVDAYVGVAWLDAKLANYYYGVGATEATATRSLYRPGGGSELDAGLHFNFDFGRRSTVLFGYEATRLGDSLANSPIAERRMSNLFFIGYGWRL